MEMTAQCLLSLPSRPPESGTRLHCVLTAACQASLSVPVHMPSPFLGVQCNPTQASHTLTAPEPLRQSRWRDRQWWGHFSLLAQVVPSLNLSFPRGLGLGRRWPRPTSTRLSPIRNNILAYSFIQQTLTEHPAHAMHSSRHGGHYGGEVRPNPELLPSRPPSDTPFPGCQSACGHRVSELRGFLLLPPL